MGTRQQLPCNRLSRRKEPLLPPLLTPPVSPDGHPAEGVQREGLPDTHRPLVLRSRVDVEGGIGGCWCANFNCVVEARGMRFGAPPAERGEAAGGGRTTLSCAFSGHQAFA